MDFVGGGGGGNGGLGSDNGPILYSEPNRTSAIDDIRSVVIYIFIVTIFLSFFLILPGIRNEKFPTFLCITTSLIVTSILLVSLLGTTWHVGEAPISAAYKAFSRDRIQGDLSVKIGLQSVNITLRAQKYYILHSIHGPIIMDNSPIVLSSSVITTPPSAVTTTTARSTSSKGGNLPVLPLASLDGSSGPNLAEELLRDGHTSDVATVDTELEADEVFATPSAASSSKFKQQALLGRTSRSSNTTTNSQLNKRSATHPTGSSLSFLSTLKPRTTTTTNNHDKNQQESSTIMANGQKFTIKRVNVDINYNERFYWIEPNQMRQEHHHALERGLPYPILTVVEYLSQDEAGFSWSRQYRLAGYYTHILLWLSICTCLLMFILHCAAPKYGIYTMQILGCMLLFTNFTYATLVPRGEQKLVIPFEGQSLSFRFGWNFWLVLIGGCLSLSVGTLIVIIDSLFPNFIFTTILDVDYDSHHKYYKHRRKQDTNKQTTGALERPIKPPFIGDSATTSKTNFSSKASMSSTKSDGQNSNNSSSTTKGLQYDKDGLAVDDTNGELVARSRRNPVKVTDSDTIEASDTKKPSGNAPHLSELFVGTLMKRSASIFLSTAAGDSDTQNRRTQKKQDSSVVEMLAGDTVEHHPSTTTNVQSQSSKSRRHHHNPHQHHRHNN